MNTKLTYVFKSMLTYLMRYFRLIKKIQKTKFHNDCTEVFVYQTYTCNTLSLLFYFELRKLTFPIYTIGSMKVLYKASNVFATTSNFTSFQSHRHSNILFEKEIHWSILEEKFKKKYLWHYDLQILDKFAIKNMRVDEVYQNISQRFDGGEIAPMSLPPSAFRLPLILTG